MPKLSVLMPCKNLNNSCKKSIASILAQDVDLELIITIDGGENNLEINDPRVIVKRFKKNLGPSCATNYCYKYSTGDYITVHDDDDDWSHPNRYRILSNEIKGNRVITSNINVIEDGKCYTKYFNTLNFIHANKVKPPAHHCATIIRRDLWEELGNYDERFIVSDSIRMIRLGMYLLIKQEPFIVYDEPLYNYVVRDGSLSSTIKWEVEAKRTRYHILKAYKEHKREPLEFLHSSKLTDIQMEQTDAQRNKDFWRKIEILAMGNGAK